MRRSRILIVLACLLGLALNFYLWRPFFPYVFARANNDFVMVYTGAVLAGSPGLYDAGTVLETQHSFGDSPQFLVYPRWPCFAVLIAPLRWLSFLKAYWVWQSISLAAVWTFLAIWPGRRKWLAAIMCCWSLPLANCFMMGQDTTLVLAALAASLAMFFRRRYFVAGLLLALCAYKFQFFIAFALLVVIRRLWRYGAGAATGIAALLAASFAIQGWRWPADYVQILSLKTTTPSYGLMPNLHGLLSGHPHSPVLMGVAVCIVVLATAIIMRSTKITIALAAAIIGGMLLSYHAFIADAVLLLPAGLLLMRDKASRTNRAAGMILLSPLPFLAFRLDPMPYPPAAIIALSLLVMVAAAIPAVRQWSLRRHLPAAAPGRT